MADRGFGTNEASELLKRAAARARRDSDEPSLSHEELLETAREVGLEPAQLEEVLAEAERDRQLAEARAAWTSEHRAKLARSAPMWALATVLAVAAYFFFGGYAFLLWIVAAWGLLVGWRTLSLMRGPSAKELEWKRTELQRQLRSGDQARGELPASSTSAAPEPDKTNTEPTPTSEASRAFLERLEQERRSRPPLQIQDSGVEGVGAGHGSDDDKSNR